MPTFLMLSTLGPEGMATLRTNPARLQRSERRGRGDGLFGRSAVGAARGLRLRDDARGSGRRRPSPRVAVALGARGTLKTRTLTAIPIDEFIELLS